MLNIQTENLNLASDGIDMTEFLQIQLFGLNMHFKTKGNCLHLHPWKIGIGSPRAAIPDFIEGRGGFGGTGLDGGGTVLSWSILPIPPPNVGHWAALAL